MMTLKQFKKQFSAIEKFWEEHEQTEAGLKLICSRDFVGYSDLGFGLLEAYIQLLANAVGDNGEWIDWYVHENNMGKAGLKCKTASSKRWMLVNSPTKLYNLIKAK
jgi:hypothetical protein